MKQGDQRPSPAARSAVASCCINSAAMLQLADGDGYTDKKRAGFRELNERQAQMLFRAADIADDMLAALREAAEALKITADLLETEKGFGGTAQGIRVDEMNARAAIAKAEGKS